MDLLPNEILMNIFHRVNPSSIYLVCKKWHNFSYKFGIRKSVQMTHELCKFDKDGYPGIYKFHIMKEIINSYEEKCLQSFRNKLSDEAFSRIRVKYSNKSVIIKFYFSSHSCLYDPCIKIVMYKTFAQINIECFCSLFDCETKGKDVITEIFFQSNYLKSYLLELKPKLKIVIKKIKEQFADNLES